MGSLYNKVKVNNPGRSFFNLSYDKKFDCDAGQLIPICCEFVEPGTVIKYGNEIVARMNPLVAPVMHEVNIYTQYFFVPLRIMFGHMKAYSHMLPDGTVDGHYEWDVYDHDLENFLTGGKSGLDTSVSLPTHYTLFANEPGVHNDNYVHKVIWDADTSTYSNAVKLEYDAADPYTLKRGNLYFEHTLTGTVCYSPTVDEPATKDYWVPLYPNEFVARDGIYSLWDYLGFPIGVNPSDIQVSDFPFRAYALIWNNFFRDQNLMDEVDPVKFDVVKNVCWNKDYFTAAYTELQRGQSPALPLSSSLLPVLQSSSFVDASDLEHGQFAVIVDSTEGTVHGHKNGSSSVIHSYDNTVLNLAGNAYPFLVDASGLFNVNDLRLAMRVQEWLEVNLRVGTHLNEFLMGHFGTAPNDETLQRPVYLGGSKSPVIVSEVLQTSQTTQDESGSETKGSPQGNMAGHGISADRNFIGSYHAKEFGVLMGVMYIRPKATYQQGVKKTWLYQTKYDFPFPEFAHLGNSAIFQMEVFATDSNNTDANDNPLIFGYTERYNELRSNQSQVCGGLRTTFDFWHLGRIFQNAPNLNADFVRCVPDKRIFAVETEPGFICNVGNILHAYRPLPYFGDPRT